MKACRRVEVPLHTLPTSALFESEWSAWRPGRIIPCEIAPTAPLGLWTPKVGLDAFGNTQLYCFFRESNLRRQSCYLITLLKLLRWLASSGCRILSSWCWLFGLVGEMNFRGTVSKRRRFDEILCGRSSGPAGYGIWGPDGSWEHHDYGILGCDTVWLGS